jgi:gamma-aminobutyric acid type B receptor
MSLQEPISERGLDMACMCTPWLLFSGYAIAFSALLSKSWRINTLIRYGKQFRRVKVGISDAMFPLAVLMLCNISLLVMWTVMSPVTWERIQVANYDEYGRSVESYGRCEGDGSTTTKVIISLMAIVNGLGLVFTNYQGIKTRALPTAFNESFYLAIANASLLEALILGIPILVLAKDSPSTSFIVKAILVTLVCLCVLLPLFIPKHLQRGNESKRNAVRQSIRSCLYENSNLFQEPKTVPEDCLGTRITRHEHYYVQRKIPPPPGGAAIGSLRLGSSKPRLSSAELPAP